MDNPQQKVLMIDDESDIVNFFTKSFGSFKHIQFFKATRAIEGIEIAKREKPDVVLIDLRMPGMNGEEALRELRPLLPDSRFIVMTGWEDGAVRERIEREIGISAYYPKPVDLEKVITKVMSLLMVKK